MKIKRLTITLASLLILSTAYCQDSSLPHSKNRDSLRIHRSDTSWKNNSMKKNRSNRQKADTTYMNTDKMKKSSRKSRNTSPKADSLKQ